MDRRQEKDMKRKVSVLTLCAMIFALCVAAQAQQPKKISRIGYIGSSASEQTATNTNAFRERLRELGYIEGQNITIEYRYFEGKIDRLPELAAELNRLNCDVIVTTGTEAAAAAKKVIKTLPVVMAFSGDAVRLGIVADLAHPGGNITGLTSINAELSGKRLELLKDVVPGLSRVALLWSAGNVNMEYLLRETESVARSLRVGVLPLAARSSRHRLSRGEEFLFLLPSYQLVSVWSSRLRAPVFNRSVSDFGPHQFTHQDQGCGRILKREFLPAPGNLVCPRKLSVPRRVQGYRIHRSPGSPLFGSNPSVAHGVGA